MLSFQSWFSKKSIRSCHIKHIIYRWSNASTLYPSFCTSQSWPLIPSSSVAGFDHSSIFGSPKDSSDFSPSYFINSVKRSRVSCHSCSLSKSFLDFSCFSGLVLFSVILYSMLTSPSPVTGMLLFKVSLNHFSRFNYWSWDAFQDISY